MSALGPLHWHINQRPKAGNEFAYSHGPQTRDIVKEENVDATDFLFPVSLRVFFICSVLLSASADVVVVVVVGAAGCHFN